MAGPKTWFLQISPRSWIRAAEVAWLPEACFREEADLLQQAQNWKIALVKQEVLASLPNLPGRHPIRDFVASSNGHTGCLSFLHELRAELLVVRAASEPECSTWLEKFHGDPDPQAHRRAFEQRAVEETFWSPIGPQTRRGVARHVDEIDWNIFDLVVSLDIAIPTRILRRHPRVVWAYMITESGMPAYRASRREPLHGYDLFLNQSARRFPVRPWAASHEIDLPWAFQTRDCYGWNPRSENGSVGLDSHTWKLVEEGSLSLPKHNPGIPIRGRPLEFLGQYAQSRYFLRMGPRKTWGTSLLEASCAGCLVLGDPQSVVHPAPLLPALQARNPAELHRRLAWLEDHPNERAELWRRQQAKTRDLAFLRPLRHLVDAVEAIRKARGRQP
jgi:hypothetical protein